MSEQPTDPVHSSLAESVEVWLSVLYGCLLGLAGVLAIMVGYNTGACQRFAGGVIWTLMLVAFFLFVPPEVLQAWLVGLGFLSGVGFMVVRRKRPRWVVPSLCVLLVVGGMGAGYAYERAVPSTKGCRLGTWK